MGSNNKTTFHLINDEWKRVTLHHHIDINLITVALRKKKQEKIILLQEDGTGMQVRPIIPESERTVSQSEMVLIQLSATNLI